MGSFNKFGKGQGGGYGGNKFGGGRPSFGGRGDGPRPMHQATCGDCGQSCEVPFRPTGDRPVFCSNCFKGKDGGSKPSFAPKRFDRGDFNGQAGGFNTPNNSGAGVSKAQIDSLNVKLDKIISLLSAPKEAPKTFVVEAKPAKAEKKAKAPAKKAKSSKK